MLLNSMANNDCPYQLLMMKWRGTQKMDKLVYRQNKNILNTIFEIP